MWATKDGFVSKWDTLIQTHTSCVLVFLNANQDLKTKSVTQTVTEQDCDDDQTYSTVQALAVLLSTSILSMMGLFLLI